MKRKLMVIEEIDCGDTECGGCQFLGHPFGTHVGCRYFHENLYTEPLKRLHACLEAERKFQIYLDSVCLVAGARAAGRL